MSYLTAKSTKLQVWPAHLQSEKGRDMYQNSILILVSCFVFEDGYNNWARYLDVFLRNEAIVLYATAKFIAQNNVRAYSQLICHL